MTKKPKIILINPYMDNYTKLQSSVSDTSSLESDSKIISFEDDIKSNTIFKSQRITNNLGYNTAKTQEESYLELEKKSLTHKCTDSNHQDDRILPIRKFYLNKGGKSLQGACIQCQTNRRANRIKRSREKFSNKTKVEICNYYLLTYGQTKKCSKCNILKHPSEFPISISMETGLHNHCIICSIGNSQGNGGIRDFIFMPDKDGIKYKKKDSCEICGGNNKLAVDHILPIAKGGTDCITNKQTLCIHCNSKKSDTINTTVTFKNLCTRYHDNSLDFTDYISLSQSLSKKVYEFRNNTFDLSSLDQIKLTIQNYIKKYNLGHNVDRILNKIAIIFHKI